MKKIEVLVSSLQLKDVKENKVVVLKRGDHYPVENLGAANVEQMIQLKYVKALGKEADPQAKEETGKRTRKAREVSETDESPEVTETSEETSEDGEF